METAQSADTGNSVSSIVALVDCGVGVHWDLSNAEKAR
jgi:hypothetical protein